MKKLFVISGGIGNEREVSLSSGENIVETLKREEVLCEHIVVDNEKRWLYGEIIMSEEEGFTLLQKEEGLVFQVIHGTYGEDGELVRTLEKNNVAYIGSSSLVLEKTIDKYETELLLQSNNIRTTESYCIKNNEDVLALENTPFPLIIKPNKEGSSVGIIKVNNEEELKKGLEKSLSEYSDVLVQKYITGREFTCGVIEVDGKEIALTPTEVILTKGELFDYEAKYSEGGCLEITPAKVDEIVIKKIKDLALMVHRVCGCKDISRTDIMMNENGDLIVLEINTVPGMTKTSFIPAELDASGISLVSFVKGMIKKYS